MNYDYCFGNFRWRIQSSVPLVENEQSRIFRWKAGDNQPDWICRLEQVQTLPAHGGELVGADSQLKIYLQGKQVWLERLNRKDGEPVQVASYPLMGDGQTCLWGLKGHHPYTVCLDQIWAAVDLPFHLLQRGIVTLHCATVDIGGRALLFVAPSGTGKSTQANLWRIHRGARILNGDKVGILVREGKIRACGLPICGTSGIAQPFELPVAGLVLLSQGRENVVSQLRGIRGLGEIMKNCFGHSGLPGCQEKILSILLTLVEQVPVYVLECRPDEQAVSVLERALEKGL